MSAFPLKKGDIVLAAAVLLAAAALFFLPLLAGAGGAGAYAEIYVSGVLTVRHPLDTDAEFRPVPGVLVTIRDGAARIVESDCPDQLCVLSGPIRRSGAMLVCAPRLVAVKISGPGEEADAIVR